MATLEQDLKWLKEHQDAAIVAFERGQWHPLKCLLRMIERIEKRIESYAEV